MTAITAQAIKETTDYCRVNHTSDPKMVIALMKVLMTPERILRSWLMAMEGP